MSTQTLTIESPQTPLSEQDDVAPVLQPVEVQEPETSPKSNRLQKLTVVTQLSVINFANSAVNGLVVVGLPAITDELHIPQSLALWPTSVSSLANASTLLLAGAIADSIGPKKVNIAGGLLSGAFMIGSGLSKSGEQLVAMRAIQGMGYAMHLASSVSILTSLLPRGRARNVGFGCLGLSQPLGFSFGLVLGGVLQAAVGWRMAWFIYGALTLFFALLATWAIPAPAQSTTLKETMVLLKNKVDWTGALLATIFMTLLSYLLATISADIGSIHRPETILFICISALALPAFIYWAHIQTKRGKAALIPNALWRNVPFSVICGTVALSFGVTTCIELFSSLFFQEVQHDTPLIAGLKVIPSLLVGTLLNFTTGMYVHKLSARKLVTFACAACAISPLLMATVQPSWPYWANAFIAQIFCPISTDVLFTVGLLIISDVFPDDTQALAGAVFNTASQFGNAMCLAIMQIVSTLITQDRGGKDQPLAVMEGLRASFWTMFGLSVACTVLVVFGLRNAGHVGLKRD